MPKKAKILRLARSALVLKVTLLEVKPLVWRRLRVAGDLTLRELHHVLQIALGWSDSHLHEFEVGGRRYGMPIADPSNERHEELREWVGPDFDPEAFDLAAVNRALRGAGSATWRRKRERFYGRGA